VALPARFRFLRRTGNPAALRIGAVSIRNVRPVKSPHGGLALNKAARLVLRGEIGPRRVKIYEAASPVHAAFIATITASAAGPVRLAPIVEVGGRFVVAEWVEGTALSKGGMGPDVLERLVEFQVGLGRIEASAPSGFDYWEEIIVPRFLRAAELVGCRGRAERSVAAVREWRAGASATVNHPDVSLDNVVVNARGEHVAIDNELLYRAPGAFMDLLNVVRSLPAESRPAYLRSYADAAGENALPPSEVVRAFWFARQAGAAFVGGRIEPLVTLFEGDEASAGDEILSLLSPPL
jgi:phosphotransferase family enzyme